MNSNLVVIALAAVVVLQVGNAAGRVVAPNYYEAGIQVSYDCSGKADGNYPHPQKCTHYIACVAHAHAYEMACAMGLDGNLLHYVASSGPNPATSRCDYPSVAECEQPAPETTQAPEEPTQAPEEPTQAPVEPTQAPEEPTQAPEEPTQAPEEPTQAPVEPTQASEEPTQAPEEPTQAPVEPTEAPPEDEPCREHECKQNGDCQSFRVCHNGKWANRQCGKDLFWNPDVDNGFGGNCDFFKNLSQERQQEYKRDERCIPSCKWWQNEGEECSGTYHYRAPFNDETLEGRESTLQCPDAPANSGEEDLVWNPKTLTCDKRSNVDGC